jgi:hypothetical protein
MKAKLPTITAIASLLKQLKPTISDEYRCTDDPDDNTPGMLVTIGASPDGSWHYQTGDNSYSGGAYCHKYWGLVYLHRRTNSREAARQAIDEIAEIMASDDLDV